MNDRKLSKWMVLVFALVAALLLNACAPGLNVSELRTESQSVELGDAASTRVDIKFGAGDLKVAGGAEDLLEASFRYNVDELKPEVVHAGSTLSVRQPGARGLPDLRDITGFRNEWDLRLNNEVPIDLSLDIGAGTSNLQLAGLSLTRLDITMGGAGSTIDLSGGWMRDLDVSIDAGAASLTVVLPRDVGARVEVGDGPHTVDVTGLVKEGDAYTNAAYGVSDVTLRVNLEAGIGFIYLVVEEEAAATYTPIGQ